MATMNDVARVAEVSIATVSHVINGTRFVSPERVERVHAAMRELAYTPDATARSLRVGRTDTIGLVIPDNSNPFFAELARWIEDAGFEAGYTTILANSNERPYRERRYINTLLSKRVDGLIITPTADSDNQALVASLRKAQIPIVVMDRDVTLPMADVVLYDDAAGSGDAARHLLELGHTKFACIAGPPGVPAERLEGFLTALRDAGTTIHVNNVVAGDFHFASGREATATLLATGKPFTALFAANDLMAAGAIRTLAEHGLAVPEDVSVVGFDDAPIAEMISPPLTTVRQPLQDMADVAVSLLLARVSNNAGKRRTRRVLPTSLVVRDSTAPPRRRRSGRS
ncbi:MAG: LacI family transcriptional regulator [Solirubrobacteraceae bacterium]